MDLKKRKKLRILEFLLRSMEDFKVRSSIDQQEFARKSSKKIRDEEQLHIIDVDL